MALSDVLNRARVEERELPLLGKVKIRRLSAGQMLEIGEKKRSGLHLVLAAVLVDADHNTADVGGPRPAFASLAEIEACDWDVVSALIDACNEVNRLPKGRDSAPNS